MQIIIRIPHGRYPWLKTHFSAHICSAISPSISCSPAALLPSSHCMIPIVPWRWPPSLDPVSGGFSSTQPWCCCRGNNCHSWFCCWWDRKFLKGFQPHPSHEIPHWYCWVSLGFPPRKGSRDHHHSELWILNDFKITLRKISTPT